MSCFSSDPLFDLAKYAMQVCLHTFPTRARLKLFKSRKKKRQCYDMPWWGTKHYWAIREYHSRSRCELCFISKDYKNSKLLRCENGKRWLCLRAVPFLNHSRRYDRHSTYPTSTRYIFGIIVMLVSYLELPCLCLFYPNLCSGQAKI